MRERAESGPCWMLTSPRRGLVCGLGKLLASAACIHFSHESASSTAVTNVHNDTVALLCVLNHSARMCFAFFEAASASAY